MQKKITHILKGRDKEIAPGAGSSMSASAGLANGPDSVRTTVLQPLPHADFRFANPFIVLHHMPPRTILPGSHIRLPMHPHRGFSPVTFQLQGEGYHLDNAGNE